MEPIQVVILPGKAPFHAGLFFSAVRHLLGEPDRKMDAGFDGVYIWGYDLNTKDRERQITDAYPGIVGFMKCFDLLYPESICEIAKWGDQGKKPECDSLHIRIQHPVPKRPT